MASRALDCGHSDIIVPAANPQEAAVLNSLTEIGKRKSARESSVLCPLSSVLRPLSSVLCPLSSVRPANHLSEVVEFLNCRSELPVFKTDLDNIWNASAPDELDFEGVKARNTQNEGWRLPQPEYRIS
jgi:hypothetical protein